MRALHRWGMSVFIVLLCYWAVSGLTLAIWDVTDASQGWNEGGGPGARPTGVAATHAPLGANAGELLATLLRLARAQEPGIHVASLELLSSADGTRGLVTTAGANPRMLSFDLHTLAFLGAASSAAGDTGMPTDVGGPGGALTVHNQIKNWHRGNIVGTWGVAVAMLTGVALTFMALTGIVLYFKLWSHRRASARHAFFWS